MPAMDETIPALFARQAAALGGKALFLVKRAGVYQPITWRQASDEILSFAGFLIEQHVQPGDRVLILSENRPEWGMADLATQAVGAWSVPLYPSLTAPDVQLIASDCQPAVCIASTPEQVSKLLSIQAQVPSIRVIVSLSELADPASRTVTWAAAVQRGHAAGDTIRQSVEARQAKIQPDATATLIYTSGTTGEPKGVMLSHRNFLSNASAALSVIPVTSRDLHLSFLPLSHVFERMAGWYLMLLAGATVAYAESMETISENMLEAHPTIMLGVPRFFEKLYAKIQDGVRHAPRIKRHLAEWAFGIGRRLAACASGGQRAAWPLAIEGAIADLLVFRKLKARLGGRLRFFVSGGAPLSKEIGEFFYGAGIVILEGYGLTETSPVIAVNRLEAPCFGSVGKLLPGVEVQIAEDGEILTRGPHVMQGYYRRAEATQGAIIDGWFHTGDIGHLDAQGRLAVTDRKKDLIKTAGGKFIAPQKLENLFVTDRYISQAFVYGDRRPYCVALIVPNAEPLRRFAQEQEIAGGSIRELVRDARVQAWYWQRVNEKQQGLAGFEQVKKIALLDEEFSQAGGELTPTLKAKRSVIASRYASVLEGLYAASEP